jgi:DNA topoisomerase-1
MHVAESNTAITTAGVKFATKTNTSGWSISATRCQKSGNACAKTWLCGLPRRKVLATVVQLLERTFIRVGNVEYARANKSFGLTTMQDRHVDVKGAALRFHFRGKSGRMRKVELTDRRIAKIVSKLQDLPGQELFQYVDEEGVVRDVTSQNVNEYLHEITGEHFTAKDFRTWAGTVLAAIALNAEGGFKTKKQAKANIKNAISAVAKLIGNTPSICRKCYVHPALLETYLDGNFIAGLNPKNEENGRNSVPTRRVLDLHSGEAAILKFLRSHFAEKAA